MGYLGNFIVYTLAMVGVIVVALLVFKNATSVSTGRSSKHLKVLDTLNIGQRKMLYVVSAGKEKFLIAGDTDRTTLISKLENFEEHIPAAVTSETTKFNTKTNESIGFNDNEKSFKEIMLSKPNFMDKKGLGIKSSMISNKNSEAAYTSVIRSLAERIRG